MSLGMVDWKSLELQLTLDEKYPAPYSLGYVPLYLGRQLTDFFLRCSPFLEALITGLCIRQPAESFNWYYQIRAY